MIISEIELKESIFNQIIKSKKYKEGLEKFNNLSRLTQEIKIEKNKIKILNKDTFFAININDYKLVSHKCNIHKEKLCECLIASILYFLNNYSFDYHNIKENSLTPFDIMLVNNEIQRGIVVKDDKLYHAEISNKNERSFYLKKYLHTEQITEDKIEYIISYQKFASTPLFFVQKSQRTLSPLRISNEFLKFFVTFEKLNDNFIKLISFYENKDDILGVYNGILKKVAIFNDATVKILPCFYDFEKFENFFSKPQIIDYETLNEIIFKQDFLNNHNIFIDKKRIKKIDYIDTVPQVDIFLEMINNYLKIEVKLRYDKFYFNIFEKKRIINGKIVFRNKLEFDILNTFENLKAITENECFLLNKKSAIDFLINILPKNSTKFNIFGEEKLTKFKIYRPMVTNSSISLFSYNEWFEIDASLMFDNKRVNLKDLIKNIKDGKNYVKLNKNEFGVIPESFVKKIKNLLNEESVTYDKNKGKLKIFKLEPLEKIDILEENVDISHAIKDINRLKEKLENFHNITDYRLPNEIKSKLRDYQKEGVKWLLFLRDFHLNGILADEMGLGKTVQALSLLFLEKENKPNLVVVPASLLFNWENEIKKFFNNINFTLLYGKKREILYENLEGFTLIITTYNIVRIDIKKLKEIRFNYIILDESQNIKNPSSIISNYIKKLHSNHRLSLTGTPFQNNLTDVWSQFDFLHPGLLGTLKDFRKKYESNVNLLRKKLTPLILRRKKEDVLKELPSKTEINYFYEMNEQQREFYESLKAFYMEKIESSINQQGFFKSKMIIIEGLLRLRQICCHPKLVKFEHVKYKNIKSEKFENLKKIIKTFHNKGSKTVIYSQFVQMLKIIVNFLNKEEIDFEYLDGTSINREERIKNFQNNHNINFFLISTKAGGLGINLTSAENVIIYDPWWNPAVENQAIDRIHRIGQEKKIFAYRMIMKDSVEEKIMKLQKIKQNILDELLDMDSVFHNLTREDIQYIFE